MRAEPQAATPGRHPGKPHPEGFQLFRLGEAPHLPPRRLRNLRDTFGPRQQIIQHPLQPVNRIAEVMPSFLEQDGDLLVRLLHQGHGPAGHGFEEAHVGLAANSVVEDEPAAIEDVDIGVIESLAQVDRTAGAMGPARHARQQPVAFAVQARVQVAAEGDVQIA